MTVRCDWFTWITAQADGTEHAVTEKAEQTSRAARRGAFEAMCGEIFLCASMDVGPSRTCPRCRAFIQARAEMRSFEEVLTEHRRPGWLARLLNRYVSPEDVGSQQTQSPAAPRSTGPRSTGEARRRRVNAGPVWAGENGPTP